MTRAVLIGCGGIANAWLSALARIGGVELVALVDLNRDAAEAMKAKYELGSAVYTDLASALAREKPGVAFDCTVPAAHAAVDTACLEAGCHVLVEKPLADTMDAARAVVRTASANGRIHAVMQNRRYNPQIIRYRDTLRNPELGGLHTLYADFFIPAHFGGFRAEMEHVLLLDMAIHTFDEARFLSGSRPQRITCTEWNPPGSWYDRDASAIMTAEMDGGIVFNYRGSWCAEGHQTSWESAWRGICRAGTALWDGHDTVSAERVGEPDPPTGGDLIRPAVPVDVPDAPELDHTGHAGCIAEFLECVRAGREPMTVSHDNIYSLAMSLGAVDSAEAEKPITVRGL